MTADVNVTEKVARASNPGAFFPWSKPHERDHEIARAERALSALADPDVQAGIAGVLAEHQPWLDETAVFLGECMCGPEPLADLDAFRMHVTAAVVEWLRGERPTSARHPTAPGDQSSR